MATRQRYIPIPMVTSPNMRATYSAPCETATTTMKLTTKMYDPSPCVQHRSAMTRLTNRKTREVYLKVSFSRLSATIGL